MLDKLSTIGDDVYRSWSYAQRHIEIGRLVDGYKNGMPAQILCQMAASIAGSPEQASEHLAAVMSKKERKAIIRKEAGSNRDLNALLKATLL